jgi:hypothetical protein
MNVPNASAVDGQNVDPRTIELSIEVDLREQELVNQVILNCVLRSAQARYRLS